MSHEFTFGVGDVFSGTPTLETNGEAALHSRKSGNEESLWSFSGKLQGRKDKEKGSYLHFNFMVSVFRNNRETTLLTRDMLMTHLVIINRNDI